MEGMGVDQCWDGMAFSMSNDYYSIGDGSPVNPEPNEEEFVLHDAFGVRESPERPFVDDLLLKEEDVALDLVPEEPNMHFDDIVPIPDVPVEHEHDVAEVPNFHADHVAKMEDMVSEEIWYPFEHVAEPPLYDANHPEHEHEVLAHHQLENHDHYHQVSQVPTALQIPGAMPSVQAPQPPQAGEVEHQPAVNLNQQPTDLQKRPGVNAISPLSNSPGERSPLSTLGGVQEALVQVPKKGRNVRSKRSGRSVSEKYITRAATKTRIYANPTASHFCHICWRRAKYTPMAVCSNIQYSSCRKVICQKCFIYFKWDWEMANAPGSNFKCTHCLNACPEGAQCYTYGKTNLKRRSSKAQESVTQTALNLTVGSAP